MTSLTISQSKAKTWRSCKAKYHMKYVKNLSRKRKSRPLQFGTIMHEMIDELLAGRDPFKKLEETKKEKGQLFKEEIDEYGNIVDDLELIFREYIDYWPKNDIKIIPIKGLSSEHEFEMRLFDGMIFKGRIDFVAQSNKLVWLGENKTFGRMPSDDHRWRDLQTVVYVKPIEMMGMIGSKKIDGVLWNYIHSKAPTIPQVKNNGEMSTRKISTFPSVVKRVAKEYEIPLKDITEQLELAAESRSEWFERIYAPVNKSVSEFIWKGFVDTAKEIAENHDKLTEMNIDRHCDWCDYESICRARMQGNDVDFVIEREYEVKQDAKEKGPTKPSKQPTKVVARKIK